VDHTASTRDSYSDGTDRARFASAQFGAGANVKRTALEKAMVLAGIGEELVQAA
jgi:hypothetical protein